MRKIEAVDPNALTDDERAFGVTKLRYMKFREVCSDRAAYPNQSATGYFNGTPRFGTALKRLSLVHSRRALIWRSSRARTKREARPPA